MDTLQKKIEERALNKLKSDLEYLTSLPNIDGSKYYNLCKDIYVNIGTIDKPNAVKLIYIFSQTDIYKQIIDSNIEKYVKKETDLFLKEIEDLKLKIEDCETSLNNIGI